LRQSIPSPSIRNTGSAFCIIPMRSIISDTSGVQLIGVLYHRWYTMGRNP
jgi:hypothetical protein